ncbi:bifunctional apoptosis regulator-like isoform X1 [Ictalurus furcatus]|uniref:bifunctional apoptosis regulator-like isoform X1 n=2 Tax=Ictalurus furcatus TaxID=66913 RepID=UPI00234FDA1F|nr:bifunctional apoptosis regulator-like isoform X1 [Ictalurus furcatus]
MKCTDMECDIPMSDPELRTQSDSGVSGVSECVLLCHCCYDVLVNPTTLTCGHSFCRHCLAQWWESSRRTECPECREPWQGFPKVNILLRDAVEELHGADVRRRLKEIQDDARISLLLLSFQRFGDKQANHRSSAGRAERFYFGVFLTLCCVMVMFLMLLLYRWSSGGIRHEDLVSKPISRWTVDDVTLWMEQLGAWTSQYRETFLREQVNGRLLNLLGDDELFGDPFHMENPSHRRAILQEIHRVQTLGVKPPRNLWEYKVVNEGKSLFLVYGLKDSPRLTLLLLYLFDYDASFLPLIHTCCTSPSEQNELTEWVWPSQWQWAWFVVKWLIVPYQLIAAFACDQLSVHYWTSRIVILNAVLLSLREGHAVWHGWTPGVLRMLPQRAVSHVWEMGIHSMFFMFLWPLLPQCVWSGLFYWGLYCSPAYNTHTILKQLLRHTYAHRA